jgi:hypothetical protein
MEKYTELNKEIREIESNLEADKGEILALLYELNPDNDIDEAGINQCAGDARAILESLIQKAGEDTEFNLERKKTERARVEKESKNSQAHLSSLRESMNSTKNEFQKPENEKTMSALFSKLNDAFTYTLPNNQQAQNDYDKVYSFIADDNLNCITCNDVRTSSQFIQKKIKGDDTTWADNFNKKISVSLANVTHEYDFSEIDNILKFYKTNSPLVDVIKELHKLYSGCKDKKDINDFKLKSSTKLAMTPQSAAKPPPPPATTPQLSRNKSKKLGFRFPGSKGGSATNKTSKQ